MDANRITYLDSIKGAAIILVVFCHHVVLSDDSIIGNIFMSFAWAAVPCFFMVTGGLMHNAKSFTWKKYIGRILKIYFTLSIWKLLYLCFYIIVDNVHVDAFSVVKYLFFMGNLNEVDTNPMWFMCAYLQALCIFPMTYYLHKDNQGKKSLIYLLVVMWIASFLIPFLNLLGVSIVDDLLVIVPFYGFLSMIFYFLLGSFMYDYRDYIRNIISNAYIRKTIPYLLILIGIVGAVFFKYSYTESFGWNGIYLSNGYNRISTMLMGIGLYLLFLLECCPKGLSLLFSKLGKHTMGIYYLHYPMLFLYKKICHNLIENYSDYYSFVLNVVQTFIVVCICLVITIVAKKIPIIKKIFL